MVYQWACYSTGMRALVPADRGMTVGLQVTHALLCLVLFPTLFRGATCQGDSLLDRDVRTAVHHYPSRLALDSPQVPSPLLIVMVGFDGGSTDNITITGNRLRAYLESLHSRSTIETVMPSSEEPFGPHDMTDVDQGSRQLPFHRAFSFHVTSATHQVLSKVNAAISTAVQASLQQAADKQDNETIIAFRAVDRIVSQHYQQITEYPAVIYLLNPARQPVHYVYSQSSTARDGTTCPSAWYESGSGFRYLWADIRAGVTSFVCTSIPSFVAVLSGTKECHSSH
jgi:hypothetical protein